MSDVTDMLKAVERGEARSDQLLPLVYGELRQLATAKMAREAPDHTLQPTALVHEAYARMVGADRGKAWDGRGHFFAAAAEAMRRILVEDARRKKRQRHGGERRRVELADEQAPPRDVDLVALDEALHLLGEEDPRAARVVELRYFAGLSHEQVAETLGETNYHVRQKWTYARAWLRDRLRDDR